MVTTAFLSMWLSNTATTAMMVPIAQAVLMELKQHRKTAEGNAQNINITEHLLKCTQSKLQLSSKKFIKFKLAKIHCESKLCPL